MSLRENIREIDNYNKKSIARAKKTRRKRLETVTRVISGDTTNAKCRNKKI